MRSFTEVMFSFMSRRFSTRFNMSFWRSMIWPFNGPSAPRSQCSVSSRVSSKVWRASSTRPS